MPFSVEEFLKIFEQYNTSIWPMQIFLNLLAIVAVVLVFVKRKYSSKVINAILAFFWLWMGIVYHLLNFSSINKAAYFFGILFIFQSVIFIYYGVVKSDFMNYNFKADFVHLSGIVFIIYALIIYPILSSSLGHLYPETPTFGLPCPTTIFTFGMLLFLVNRIRWYIFIIPFLWSLIGFSAAISLTIKEDFGLAAVGIISAFILIFVKPKVVIS